MFGSCQKESGFGVRALLTVCRGVAVSMALAKGLPVACSHPPCAGLRVSESPLHQLAGVYPNLCVPRQVHNHGTCVGMQSLTRGHSNRSIKSQ